MPSADAQHLGPSSEVAPIPHEYIGLPGEGACETVGFDALHVPVEENRAPDRRTSVRAMREDPRPLELFREVRRKQKSGENRFDRMAERMAGALGRRIEALERALFDEGKRTGR